MLPRRRIWLVLLVGLALAGGVWWLIATDALWAATGHLITYGMTRDEVEVIMGRPPRSVSRSRAMDLDIPMDVWWATDGTIIVTYDRGRVSRCTVLQQTVLGAQYDQLMLRIKQWWSAI